MNTITINGKQLNEMSESDLMAFQGADDFVGGGRPISAELDIDENVSCLVIISSGSLVVFISNGDEDIEIPIKDQYTPDVIVTGKLTKEVIQACTDIILW